MDSHPPYWPPHQPQVSSSEHQHVKGHRSLYAQAGHRQVGFIQHSQGQPAPHPDLSMPNHDLAGHGLHPRFQALSLRDQSHVQPGRCYIQQGNEQCFSEGFESIKQNPQQALNIAEGILAQGANLSLHETQRAYLLNVRALFQLGRFDDCLLKFETLDKSRIPLNNGLRMAKGRVLQAKFRLTEALPIFQELYTRSKNEKDVKVNGLALGRQYQDMGQHQEALTIFKKLRTDRSGHEGTPCNDKEVELALGRQYQDMGQHQEALTIFKKLRTDRSGHEGTPCNDKEVELALGDISVDLMNWHQFDQMQLDEKGFVGPEVDLCISVRYFRECIYSCQDKEISGLLTKAINHACDAIEKSQYIDASSLSQLGHCLRIAALLPVGKAPDTFAKDELNKLSSTFFTEANKRAPNRQDRLKNEDWRNTERDFLARLSSG